MENFDSKRSFMKKIKKLLNADGANLSKFYLIISTLTN